MRGIPTLFATTVLVGFSLACLGVDNVGACERYVDQVTAIFAECNADPGYDKETTCPESLNEGDVDCRAMYRCMATEYSCGDDGVEYTSANCTGCGFLEEPFHDHRDFYIEFPQF